MGMISLEGLEFFAFHGVYDEEQKIGNRFSIDTHIEVDVAGAGVSDRLDDTVDYQRVYRMIEKVMQDSSRLLEAIALHIISAVRAEYPGVVKVTVKVSKLNPPIGAICKSASVTMAG